MSGSVILQNGREKSLLRRHPWIFSNAIKETRGKMRNGDTVDVLSADGTWLCRGAWSGKSQIRVRTWTFQQEEAVDNGFFQRRIQAAQAGREMSHRQQLPMAYRVVAAEADDLPGVIVDRYGELLVCQLLSAGADKQRDKILAALRDSFPDCAILERSDVAVREKEGLSPLVQVLHGEVPQEVEILEGPARFLVDPWQGHKTGFYLDQRENRSLIAAYASGARVLNCFSYSGAMGVHCLLGGASQVTNLDLSEAALALGQRQLSLNGLDDAPCEFLQADVFKALRGYRAEARDFDLLVLDPPKFVDSKQSLHRACRGYKDINMVAMQVTRPGGLLATFSCSGLMPEDLFQKVVADAALDAGRQVQFLKRLGQALDHPVASNHPEGAYLKGLLCRVL